MSGLLFFAVSAESKDVSDFLENFFFDMDFHTDVYNFSGHKIRYSYLYADASCGVVSQAIIYEVSEDTVVPKAISGSTTITTGDYAESTIYSPGWSIWGHAEVTVTGAPVALSTIGPDGNSCIDGGVVMLNPGANQRVGMINTNHRGNYIVRVQAYSGVATVTVTLKDF